MKVVFKRTNQVFKHLYCSLAYGFCVSGCFEICFFSLSFQDTGSKISFKNINRGFAIYCFILPKKVFLFYGGSVFFAWAFYCPTRNIAHCKDGFLVFFVGKICFRKCIGSHLPHYNCFLLSVKTGKII